MIKSRGRRRSAGSGWVAGRSAVAGWRVLQNPLKSGFFEAVTSYVESIATLYDHVAFASGTAGRSVATAYRLVSNAIAHTNATQKGPDREG
jgi:hypothetical protein